MARYLRTPWTSIDSKIRWMAGAPKRRHTARMSASLSRRPRSSRPSSRPKNDCQNAWCRVSTGISSSRTRRRSPGATSRRARESDRSNSSSSTSRRASFASAGAAAAILGLDLRAELGPVVEELLEPEIRQRMFHELLEHGERHRHHVRARLRRVHHVERVADRPAEHLRREPLDPVDLTDVADEVHADVRDVVEAPEERADVVGARLRREERLGRREAERLVDADPLAREEPHRPDPVLGERALDDDVGRDLREFRALLDHPLEVGGDDLEAHVARHDRADLLDQRPEGPLLLGDERRVGRDAVDDAERDAFLELADARRIEKDLHGALLRVTRVPALTRLNTLGSPTIRPTRFTGLAGRISAPRLSGVGPKKMQKARPGGQ